MKTMLRNFLLAATLAAPVASAHAQVEFVAPTYHVRVAPPALRAEVRPVAPSPRHLWLPGFWDWRGERHEWVSGRWEVPQEGRIWVGAHWAHVGPEWVFYPGHWAQALPVATPPVPVTVEYAPPEPRVEVIPVAPSAQHVWVAGHWYWQGGQWVWYPGHWETKRTGYIWEKAHWVQLGATWRFVPGRWRPI